ncbi:PIN domain nuclease [Candidatus Oleimmundimicrobium sp.]|uniref:type II toxin-antitoxin system VapC family toxin n=1 Tax=Candidatus Oleimmundimicrobium sp. TaxID=3060597 RepID=UPI0027177B03|nr:PIN domain nuclease [Candidatus Oleimmundimicrobium sp.]MDO8885859.1 PIN domain nuclease [Candidatus Oleimmundimicrobium sp.]
MILIDTSVWIDFFRGADTLHRVAMHKLIKEDDVCLADIIVAEILQGIKSDKDFKVVKSRLLEFPIYSLKDVHSYIQSAQIYRACRRRGLTIRKLVDCFIAQIAIENGLVLFHNDKDFDSIAKTIKELQIYRL